MPDQLWPSGGAAADPNRTIRNYDARLRAILGQEAILTGQKIEWGGADGGPAAILLAPLADWCADCSAHIEELASYLSDNELPSDVNMLLVTSLDRPSAQHPQAAWLAERSWPIPTMVDSLDGAMTQWFGINSVPTWVLVASDGTVVEFVDGHNAVGVTLMAKIAALAN